MSATTSPATSEMDANTAPTGAGGVTTHLDGEGIATILINQPGSRVNVINEALIEELERAVEDLAGRGDLRGIILGSGKEGQFVAGADLEQVLEATDPEQGAEMARRLQRTLNRIGSLPIPSVAAINGPALGGGLELALACDYRVAVQSDAPTLGLPEVQLGLLPAGGGTQRLPRLVGLSRALSLILEGKRFNTRRAKRYGVIDEAVHPAVLLPAARAWIDKGKRNSRPRWDRLDRAAARWPLVHALIYRQAERTVHKKTRGHYPAPPRALDTIRAGMEQGFGAGLAAEAVAFGELLLTPEARDLIRLFWATEGLKKEQRAITANTPAVERLGVVGSGFMGSGIAQAAAAGGMTVRLRDTAPERVAAGLKTARDLTVSAARKGRFSRTQAREIISRLSGAADYSGFRRSQLVIEAVFEDLAVKRQVVADLEEVVGPSTVIASNTSSLPIAEIAAEAQHPERILGMHFFSPVHRMPLLEIVRTPATSDEAVAAAIEAGRAMGKTTIVVKDGPGFYTTRVLGAMSQEASLLFSEGASIEAVDGAARDFGFPVGMLALMDEVGLDVAAHVSQVLHGAFGDRFPLTDAISRMVESGRLGRKSGRGFYDYSGRRKKPDAAVYALRQAAPRSFDRGLIQRRLTLAFLNEAVRCLEEGIIASPRDGDVGAVMGIGFPPFLGGPFRYVDALGAAGVLAQLKQMEYAYGPRFAPAPRLLRMAEEGTTFYGGTA